MADAVDSKSTGGQPPCEFDSRPGHSAAMTSRSTRFPCIAGTVFYGDTGDLSPSGDPLLANPIPRRLAEALRDLADDSLGELLRDLTKDDQDPEIVGPLLERVKQVLTTDEQVHYVVVQKRPVVSLAPDCIVLTNRRFMVYRPTLLRKVSFEDHVWRDLVDARLQESLLGATLTFQTTVGGVIQINFLPKVQARRAYALCQEMEERVREERRARELEDKRASSGNVVVAGAPSAIASATPDPVQRLKSLKEMMDMGLISAGEYESKRAEILSKM